MSSQIRNTINIYSVYLKKVYSIFFALWQYLYCLVVIGAQDFPMKVIILSYHLPRDCWVRSNATNQLKITAPRCQNEIGSIVTQRVDVLAGTN